MSTAACSTACSSHFLIGFDNSLFVCIVDSRFVSCFFPELKKMRGPGFTFTPVLIIAAVFHLHLFSPAGAEAPINKTDSKAINENQVRFNTAEKADSDPVIQMKIHDISNIWLRVSNYGFFGNATDDFEYTDGLEGRIACQFPAGSDWDYLFQGGLWIGAIVGSDTLVSVGYDGWAYPDASYEMFPGTEPGDTLRENSFNHISPYGENYLVDGVDEGHYLVCQNNFEHHEYDPEVYYCIYDSTSISELDFNAVYSDTMATGQFSMVSVNHTRPLDIRISQVSYAWSYPYAEDFVIFDYEIENNGVKDLNKVYLALYLDGDCGPSPTGWDSNRHQDDITGFREFDDAGKAVNVAWLADYVGAGGDDVVAPSVMGVRVVRTPEKYVDFNFNWWLSDSEAERDWGPGPTLPSGTTGTPEGDVSKYLVMSNWLQDENDEDQLDAEKSGQPVGAEDTRFLLSTGPFTIQPGQTLPITLGYFCAENFYVAGDVNQRNFSDLDLNARWVQFMYDNPNVDTDGDGFYGEDVGCDGAPFTGDEGEGDGVLQNCEDTYLPAGMTDRYGYNNGQLEEGDGESDFEGPPPPNAPKVELTMGDREVILKWSSEPEEFVDSFIPELTKQRDFQGYRIYVSTTGVASEFTMLGEFDLDMVLDWYMADTLDSEGEPTQILRSGGYIADSIGHNIGFSDIVNHDSDSLEYQYRYTYGPVQNSWPLYFSVTAFDNGYYPANLNSLESNKLSSRVLIVPYTPVDRLADRKARTVPNPYRFDIDYRKQAGSDQGWEPEDSQWTEFDRRMDFVDLPENCTIRIFTMAGDLVQTLRNSDGDTILSWDLLSLNEQIVGSGIYFFVVDPEDGGEKQISKFVIIK